MLTCPNCGYKQPSGDKCQKCSSLFSYYSQSKTPPDNSAQLPAAAQSETPPSSTAPSEGFFIPWRTAYRVMSGTSLVLLLIVIFLIFHKAAPPQVRVDPQAAARAAAKLSEAQTAAQQNQPHQVTLDSTEVNSYLNSNLQLANAAAKSDTTSSTAASPAPAADSTATPAASAEAPAAEPTIDDVQSAVKDVKVNMVGDLIKAYVTFDFHGKDMSLELDGHLSSEGGYLHFEPTAGELGSLPLPQSTLDAAVDKLMSSPENREKMRLPPGINSIKIVNGQVVVN